MKSFFFPSKPARRRRCDPNITRPDEGVIRKVTVTVTVGVQEGGGESQGAKDFNKI